MKLWQIYLPLHPTWHFTVFTGAVVFGISLAVYDFSDAFRSPLWYLVALGLMILILWKRWRWLVILAVVAGMVTGLTRGSSDYHQLRAYQPYFGEIVKVSGVVSEDPDLDKQNNLSLRLKNIRLNDKLFAGSIWVSINHSSVKRSDTVVIEGKLQPGFGSFAASIYRADVIKLERPEIGDIALKVRDDFADHVRAGVKEPAASLGLGYLVGQRRALPPDLDQALQIAGLTHIVVASGYNLTILVRLMRRLMEKYSRFMTVFLAGLLIISFMMVTGLSPSMTRAGLVSGLALAAWYYGRKFHPVTLLLFAAMVTGLIEPSNVWGNLGWQLSFSAFFGVMVVAPLLQHYFFGDKPPGIFRQVLGETISAQIATAPLILLAFGKISNVALIANILILPLVPLAMLLTFIAGLAGYALPGQVEIIGLAAQWLLDYMVGVARATSSVTWAQTSLELTVSGLILIYGLLISFCLYMWMRTKYSLRTGSIIE